MDFGIAETGIARGSPPGTTTEVLRFEVPFAEIRVVSGARVDLERAAGRATLTCSPSKHRDGTRPLFC
jgi:hypothetical protein